MSKFSKFVEFNYKLSLHRDGELPEHGFGYGDGTGVCVPCLDIGLERLIEQADQWAKAFGREYQISFVSDEFNAVPKYSTKEGRVPEVVEAPVFKATAAEFYRWSHAKLVGFTLQNGETRLPGMITIDINDVERSLDSELKRYATGYTWVEKEGDKTVLRTGPWAEIDPVVAADAIRTAIAAL